MRSLFLALVVLIAVPLLADPATSVVFDSRGNVFYSDLKRVWMIRPDGTRAVAVPGVHTHELAVDAGDNLYGEHLWYEGEATDRWGHYVWRRSPDGAVTKILPDREGFLTNYSFARDRQGTMYWADRETKSIMKRMPDGRVLPLARNAFEKLAGRIAVAPDGHVWFVDRRAVKVVTPRGAIRVVAPDITHAVQGMWADGNGVYMATEGAIKRVTRDGAVSVADRSRAPWSPSGVAVAPNGDLWILEYSRALDVRVRRVRSGVRRPRRRTPDVDARFAAEVASESGLPLGRLRHARESMERSDARN